MLEYVLLVVSRTGGWIGTVGRCINMLCVVTLILLQTAWK